MEQRRSFREAPAGSINDFIKTAVTASPENALFLIDDSPIFEEPLVAFADGEDPLFYEYKKVIGTFHLTPREMLERTPPTANQNPEKGIEEISVICWVLPFAKRVRASNARRESWPSLRWTHATHYGEILNDSLRRQLVHFLARQGRLAVAPILSPLWIRHEDHPEGPTSNWSERHALYAAGMGTFGLSDGFITERGMAMRCGSVVVNLRLPPTPRKYRSHTENCPFYIDKSCSMCIDRCPGNAITAKGHDKKQCFKYRHEFFGYINRICGAGISGCGLCQTGVPCESGIPPAATELNRATR